MRISARTELIGYSDNRRSHVAMGERAEGYYVRTHRWHFWWYAGTDDMRLYDFTVDPRGRHDLSAARPDLVEGFKRTIESWKGEMGMPEAIPIYE